MYVILDTNIFYDNFHLNTRKFEALSIYFKKTRHNLILPKIVLEEIVQKYKEELEKIISLQEQTEKSYEKITGKKLNGKKITLENEIREYQTFLEEYIKLNGVRIINYNKDHYKIIVEKALYKRRPFDRKERGLRDAVLWESVKDVLKEDHKNYVAFISSNINQFCDKDGNLHEELQKEVDGLLTPIVYFKNLPTFLEKYGEQLDSITREKIQDYVSKQKVKDKIAFELSRNVVDDFIRAGHIETQQYSPENTEWSLSDFEIKEVTLKDFYVYSRKYNKFYIQCSVKVELILYLDNTSEEVGVAELGYLPVDIILGFEKDTQIISLESLNVWFF
jgi:predicted nucleic acid-binding protein